MKRISIIILKTLLWLLASTSAYATGQPGERLFWNGEFYEMLSYPLSHNEELDSLVATMTHTSTSNWSGYIGYWSIQNQQLYLDSIMLELSSDKMLIPQKEPIFKKYLKNGKLPATWVNGTLRVVSGKCIKYEHFGFARYYEHEDFLSMKDGVIQSIEREEQKLLIKGKLTTEEKEVEQFMKKFVSQLASRYPNTHGIVHARFQYSDFDNNMMPTNVDGQILRSKLTPPNEQMEHELMEQFGNYILNNHVLSLYYIKGKIEQDSNWTFPFRFP